MLPRGHVEQLAAHVFEIDEGAQLRVAVEHHAAYHLAVVAGHRLVERRVEVGLAGSQAHLVGHHSRHSRAQQRTAAVGVEAELGGSRRTKSINSASRKGCRASRPAIQSPPARAWSWTCAPRPRW